MTIQNGCGCEIPGCLPGTCPNPPNYQNYTGQIAIDFEDLKIEDANAQLYLNEVDYAAIQKAIEGEILGGMGLPVHLIQGDQSYVVKTPQTMDRLKGNMEAHLEDWCGQFSMPHYDYECPFSLLYEYEEWWEWQKRVHWDREPSGNVTTEMLDGDWKRAKPFRKGYRDFSLTARARYGNLIRSDAFLGSAYA